MSRKSNADTSKPQSSWRFFIITLVIFPIVAGIAIKTYEYCVDGRFRWCAPEVPKPTAEASSTRTPLEEQLAFSSDRDGDEELYVIRDDGSGLTQLTDNPATDYKPTWSPDGLQIAFTSNRDGDDEIYIMNADGSGVSQLTFNTAFDCCPDWSPDGSKLTFNSNWPDGDQDIYVIGIDGIGLVNITNFAGDDRNPAWSPDGTRIAFDARRDGQAEIYVMNADGTNPVRLTNLFSAERGPVWNPSGTVIAYDSNQVDGQPEAQGDHDIFIMQSDGTNQVRLFDTPEEDRWPSWSPDGQFISFTSSAEAISESTAGTSSVYVVDWVGKRLTRLINDAGGAEWKPTP